MAEALAVIGLVSAIVQFVDFGTKVLIQLHSLQDEVSNGPKAYQDIRTRLPLTLDLVKKIHLQIDAGEVKQLEDLFIKALPRTTDSSWSRGRKVILSVIKEPEVEKIDLVLKTNFDLLVHSGTYHSMSRLEKQDPGSLHQQMINVVISSQQSFTPAEHDYKQRSDSLSSQPPSSARVFMVPFQRDPKFLERQYYH